MRWAALRGANSDRYRDGGIGKWSFRRAVPTVSAIHDRFVRWIESLPPTPISIFHELLVIRAAGLCAGLASRVLNTSVIVGYFLVGALIGAGGLGWISDDGHEIESIADSGVFLLLFSIGLEFSLKELGRLGRQLLMGGSCQMLLVAAPLGALLLSTGVGWRTAAQIALAFSFSSTALVFKTLSDWGILTCRTDSVRLESSCSRTPRSFPCFWPSRC